MIELDHEMLNDPEILNGLITTDEGVIQLLALRGRATDTHTPLVFLGKFLSDEDGKVWQLNLETPKSVTHPPVQTYDEFCKLGKVTKHNFPLEAITEIPASKPIVIIKDAGFTSITLEKAELTPLVAQFLKKDSSGFTPTHTYFFKAITKQGTFYFGRATIKTKLYPNPIEAIIIDHTDLPVTAKELATRSGIVIGENNAPETKLFVFDPDLVLSVFTTLRVLFREHA